jgi:hypothetical protein
MTAEIAVINKSAIALAADSAVTISDGNGNTKIYNGAEKLFALTKYHPVGIMIYGTGTLCNVSWELIIKEYRKRIKQTCFETLDAYAEDFFQFLESETHLIPKDLREHFICQHWLHVYNQLWKQVELKVEQSVDSDTKEPSVEDTYKYLNEAAAQFCMVISQEKFLNGFSADDVNTLKEDCRKFLIAKLEQDNQIEDFPKACFEKVVESLALATVKENPFGSNSGVVFAGYGDKEYFPSVLAFNLKGFWKDKLRVIPNKNKSAVAGSSGIQAYAQDEEVLTFMHGISPRLQDDITSQYRELFQGVLSAADNLLKQTELPEQKINELKTSLLDSANDLWWGTDASIQDIIRTKYTDQVVDMVEFLPKDELAYMAESLVNMTAFKRKVTNDNETVGGPIDVAIISKGDGFVWIKRKHYFDGQLNNHYFENFLKGN